MLFLSAGKGVPVKANRQWQGSQMGTRAFGPHFVAAIESWAKDKRRDCQYGGGSNCQQTDRYMDPIIVLLFSDI